MDIIRVYDPWCPSSDARGYKDADCCEDCECRQENNCKAVNCHYRDGEMDGNHW